jgi:hypothetical protein
MHPKQISRELRELRENNNDKKVNGKETARTRKQRRNRKETAFLLFRLRLRATGQNLYGKID